MDLPRPAAFGFALLLVAATWFLRWPGLDKPIWNVDEAVTFTMAEQILHGEVPYRDAVDQRPPLAPYVQAAVFAVAGHWNLKAQHAALSIMIGLTAVLLWRMARRFGDERTGVAGALWFTLLCFVLPTVRDVMPAHTAWYLIFFSTAGYWLLARSWTTGRTWPALASGASFGLAVLAKQPALLDFGAALILIAIGLLLCRERRPAILRQLAAMAAGFAAPLLVAAAYFAARGAWADLVYYTWTYNNTLYVPEVPTAERWRTIGVPFALAWDYHPVIVPLGCTAAALLLVRCGGAIFRRAARFDPLAWLILGWSAAGLVSTTLSGRGFTHYSIQLIPGLSLACGWLSARIWERVSTWASSRLLLRGLALVGGVGAVVWILLPLPARIRALDLPEPATDVMAQLVQRHTRSDDRIFVWGYTPEVYANSRRLPATRFLYCTFVTGLIPWTNLDLLTNTDYAVVPGSHRNLLADWADHPPVLIVDGRTQRGFLKYRLEKQSWLWPLVERDYAEIEPEATDRLGSWVFRRLQPTKPAPLPGDARNSTEVEIRVQDAPAGQAARIQVLAPADSRLIDLYLDGQLYRRLAWPANLAVSAAFFVCGPDRPSATHRVQAVAHTPRGLLAGPEKELRHLVIPPVVGGPPLMFEGRSIAALESSKITGEPILPKKEAPEHWDAHAPSRLVYPWLPGMKSLAFAYGLEELAINRDPPSYTDGIEVIVQVEDQAGRVIPVFRQFSSHLDARRTRGRMVASTPLPAGAPGRIILLITPGPQNDVSFDWSYWQWVRADRTPIALLAGDDVVHPADLRSPIDPWQTDFNGTFTTVLGAPSVIEFPARPDLDELSGRFGLLDTAWLGGVKSGAVDFHVAVVRPDGTSTMLFERKLDPASKPADRGVKEFKFRLPQPLTGKLRFSAGPGANPGMAHAFWAGLEASLLRTSLRFGDNRITVRADSAGQFGFMDTEEDGQPCLLAHAPAMLSYDWREGLNRITAEFGLLKGAYEEKQTEGVIFVVEVMAADGSRRELFRRHLSPVQNAGDRGPQKLSVDIPQLPGGRIFLHTLPPPSGNLNAAWSYWRDLSAGN